MDISLLWGVLLPPMRCEWCEGRKGRSRLAVHVLAKSRNDLERHLSRCSLLTTRRIYILNLYDGAVKVYGVRSTRDKLPLALVYLESHGVKVNGREKWIEKHRATQKA